MENKVVINKNLSWVYYVNEKRVIGLEEEKCGKWLYFFDDKSFVSKICNDAVKNDIVCESKHSNADTGRTIYKCR